MLVKTFIINYHTQSHIFIHSHSRSERRSESTTMNEEEELMMEKLFLLLSPEAAKKD